MKKVRKSALLSLVFVLVTCGLSLGQGKKFTFKKVSRDIKKEAKRYEKDGYRVFPGNLPIGQQLNNSLSKQSELDKDGFPLWIVANGAAVGQTQQNAEAAAIELATLNLAKLLESNIRTVVETDLSNKQIDSETAISINKVVQVSTDRISKKLGLSTPIFKVYRGINKNTEVQVLIGYNYEYVKNQMLKEMQAELMNETEDLRAKNEKWLNSDPFKRGEVSNYSGGASEEKK
jgi:hypothetical protein